MTCKIQNYNCRQFEKKQNQREKKITPFTLQKIITVHVMKYFISLNHCLSIYPQVNTVQVIIGGDPHRNIRLAEIGIFCGIVTLKASEPSICLHFP